MNDEQRKVQASRYVLGTLPLEQVREFEAAVRADPKLQLLVKELSGTAGTKHVAAPRVRAESALPVTLPNQDAKPAVASEHHAAQDPPAPAWLGWMPWAVAACFAILCVVLISIGRSLREQAVSLNQQLEEKNTHTSDLQEQLGQLQSQIERQTTNYQTRLVEVQRQVVQRINEINRQNIAFTNQLQAQQSETQRRMFAFRDQADQLRREKQVLEEAIAGTVAAGTDPLSVARIAVIRPTGEIAPNAVGAVFWTAQTQRGMLVVENLPSLPASQSYQLWLIDPRVAKPVSGGVLPEKTSGSVRVQFTPAARLESAERFVVSIEPRGGSPAPTRVVMSGN